MSKTLFRKVLKTLSRLELLVFWVKKIAF